jgi:DNA polymerase I-like protein with 3'-5' exonuclease and polymerase domains
MTALNDKWVAYANKHGYVETLPDKTVSARGYPVECSRSEWGRISPTVPLNYHVQSTAMWCTCKAMVRIDQVLGEWRSKGFDAFIALQVHDELVLDFPAAGARNLAKVKTIKALMEESGEDIGVPLRVSVSYHPNNWGESCDPKKAKVS